ncbi:MAG: hypothetical protein M1820_010592 [Bogoriella megaspora]|nr:MAG: hypothetical protein M1820_010592 [Bogoriella megaspora]
MASQPSRPPITCHVLDTTTGQPAPNMFVLLRLLQIDNRSLHPENGEYYTAQTNDDGRVTSWERRGDSRELQEVFDSGKDDVGELTWSLTFAAGEYYGRENTFWPEVEVKFFTGRGRVWEHVHVPLLLGPFGYTTYRGS